MAEDSNNNTDVFVYTEGLVVPRHVVRVRVHPSVTAIPERAFSDCNKLEEVELCDGLLKIGKQAFMQIAEKNRHTIYCHKNTQLCVSLLCCFRSG